MNTLPIALLNLFIPKIESVGEGVTNVAVGDHVIPLYTAGKLSKPKNYRSCLNFV